MPKKISVKLCAQDFRRNGDSLLGFCSEAKKGLSANHVSRVYDGAVIRLYTDFEEMILGALIGAINNDTSQLSFRTGVKFDKHLTQAVCEYIVVGSSYFNFRGRDGLIGEIRKYVPADHYLPEAVKADEYKASIDRLCALRNFAAHNSQWSKRMALKAVGQKKMRSAGIWLKTQNRFRQLVVELNALSKNIEEKAPY